jgi:hypothetical protein
MRRMDQCETRARALERLTRRVKNAPMPLYRATALIAVMLAVFLCAGYAAGEHVDDDQEFSQAVSEDSPS